MTPHQGIAGEDGEDAGKATCCLCHRTNANLLNLGEPGAPRWACHGCCKRMLDALRTIADTKYNNYSHQLMRDTARSALSTNNLNP
jgi:transposase-like protein